MPTKKILIADDLTTIVIMVKSIMTGAGYEVITASDGLEAIHAFYTHHPDLVILDVMMPHMNGYQSCRLLKNDPVTQHIPIIMLTSRDHPIDQFWGEYSGADAYLVKDIIKETSAKKLLGTVNELLNRAAEIDFSSEEFDELSDISDNVILSRINNLLDNKLLETTIVSEIRTLVKNVKDSEKNLAGIMFLIRKLVPYDVGAVMLTDRKGNNLIVGAIVAQVDTDYPEKICRQIYREWLEKHPELKDKKIPSPQISVFKNIFNDSSPLQKQASSYLRASFKSHLIQGNFLLASHHEDIYSERDQQILDSVIQEASMVVDNMWLYRTIEQLSITDGMTGFYNHWYFFEIMKKILTNRRKDDNSFSLIMFDIDNFKHYNDTYGHQQGDNVIIETSQLVSQVIRHKDITVRYGGDEFIVLLPNTPLELAVECAERVRSSVENHEYKGQEKPLKVTVSLGVNHYSPTSYPNGYADMNKILKDTDEALYKSKEKGRNYVTVFE
ncbi:MAG: diguanylate cyclase [bacterium]